MADGKNASVTPITQEDIEALQTVLNDLKAGAKDAHDKKNLTTFRIYQKMVKMVSPEVVRANARKEREDLARMSKDADVLKGAQPRATNSNP